VLIVNSIPLIINGKGMENISMEKIIIEELSVNISIGTTEKERSKKQKILVSIEIEPEAKYDTINDDIDQTINYSSVRKDIKTLMRADHFHLIETVAKRIAQFLKSNYNIKNVTVYVKKFPYRDTKYVSYMLTM
jgi:FolB domain-containing protein